MRDIAEWLLLGSCRKYGEYEERRCSPPATIARGFAMRGGGMWLVCRSLACGWRSEYSPRTSARDLYVGDDGHGRRSPAGMSSPLSFAQAIGGKGILRGTSRFLLGALISRIPHRVLACRTPWRQCQGQLSTAGLEIRDMGEFGGQERGHFAGF